MQGKPSKNVFTVLFLFLMGALLVFSGCEKEKEVVKTVEVVIHDTVFVQIISVDSIYASPDSIAQGGSITLTAEASSMAGTGPLTFQWFAEAGTLDKPEGDTVTWKAPDDPGVYRITVHVTDGENIGIGSRMIGVGMYVPTSSPYYLGADACQQCHQEKGDEWAMTGHAHAWQTLQESGHAQSYCFPCHSVGYDPTPMSGNSGYDEAPIAKFENVQCENCHGPGSEHVGSGVPDPSKISISFDAELCGSCHNGEHHPYFDEWSSSPHAFDPNAEFPTAIPSCQGCHEGVAASIRLANESAEYPLNVFYGGGAISERPDTSEVGLKPHTCQTCHDPHSDENPGQVRTVADVVLVTANNESPVITEGGVGKLCMQCHHARRAPEPQIADGYAHFGPHANPQADMMAGKSAYHGVAPPNFPWAGPSHLLVQNSCKTCHLNMVEYGGPGVPAITGHTFEPTPEACQNCHGTITDFDDIMALDDFDGDGVVEGVQSEVQGLMDLLATALVDSFLARGVDTTGLGIDGVLGDTTLSTYKEREAGYNWVFILDDKSKGIHNPDYAIQLLQQSYQYFTGQPVPNAAIVREENAVVGNF
ncbi:MAG: hypothetical protein D6748_07645 [Calditrichaeota bacterium]|nr:MAG: hypothetical protein D6748_07645 [Calditrichota bacterium]